MKLLKITTALALLAATGLLVACSGEVKDTHPQQWVSKRQALFKNFTRTLEPMGLMARGRKDFDKAEFKASALALQDLASQPWPLFTSDSNYAPTRTKPSAWLQPAEFKQAQDHYIDSVNRLVAVSDSGDLATLKDAVHQVEQSCKSCHDHFRNDR